MTKAYKAGSIVLATPKDNHPSAWILLLTKDYTPGKQMHYKVLFYRTSTKSLDVTIKINNMPFLKFDEPVSDHYNPLQDKIRLLTKKELLLVRSALL